MNYKLVYVINKAEANTAKEVYDFDALERRLYIGADKRAHRSFEKKFAEYVEHLADKYLEGVDITVLYHENKFHYHTDNAPAFVIKNSNVPGSKMLKYKNLESLIKQKMLLENKRPLSWLNRVKALNDKIIALVNEYNGLKIQHIVNTKYNLRRDFIIQMHHDIASLSKHFLRIKNEVDTFQNYSTIALESACKALKTLLNEQPIKSLTEDALVELRQFGVAYGVVEHYNEIGTRLVYTYYRKTKDGYTEEVNYSEIEKSGFYDETGENPNWSTQTHRIFDENIALLQYNMLKYYMSYGDTFLQDGWHICPDCGTTYHENEGCPNGCIDPITFVDDCAVTYDFTLGLDETLDLETIMNIIKHTPAIKEKIIKQGTVYDFMKKINQQDFAELIKKYS